MPLGQQLIGAWNRLSLGHRALLILLSALLATALVGTVLWSGQPEFQILCTGLSAEEVSGLAGALRDAGIESRLSERGDAVLVPAAQVNQARMVAAEQGVPGAGSMGFEAFREPKIGMTPFAERITYVNALQNELAATIASLNSVVHARVHLVVPERELFARDETKPTASVLVVTRGGQTLRQRHAQAIANLVAAGVEGLSPNDVTITDGQGNVISGGGKAGAEIAAGDQLSYRRSVEEYLSDKAESMLAMVLGRNCCEVRVAAELTFEDRRQTRRQYDPEQRVVVSERIESSESSGAGTRVGGAVGSAGNVPGEQQAAGTEPTTPSTTQTEKIDTEYVVSESVQEEVTRGASIQRLTVAAFVDMSGDRPAEEETAEGEEAGAGATAAAASGPKLEDVSRIIKEAIGFNESRGDTLKIVEARFHPLTAELEDIGGGVPSWVMQVGQYGAIVVLGVVLLVIGRRVLNGIASAAPRRVVVPEIVEGEGRGGPPAELNEDEIIRREIARFVAENPEMAGRMIEGWVEGEE